MHDLNAVSSLVQAFAYFFGDHHGTVLTASATEANCEIALAFMNVVRKQVNQQIGNAVDELLRLRERTDIFCHARMTACKRPEFRNEMRVRQKANVED